jgi:hypothetical protein
MVTPNDGIECNEHWFNYTDAHVPEVERVFSSHEWIESPCNDSNPQRWGASGLKSMT